MSLISFSPKPVMASETVTVDATAGGVALTSTKYFKQVGGTASQRARANSALITVEDQQIRWNVDPAVTVSATENGHEAGDGDVINLEGQQIVDFRAIRTGGSSATIRVTYFF